VLTRRFIVYDDEGGSAKKSRREQVRAAHSIEAKGKQRTSESESPAAVCSRVSVLARQYHEARQARGGAERNSGKI